MSRELQPGEIPIRRIPRPPAPSPSEQAFVACPAAMLPGVTPEQYQAQLALYAKAFEQAKAVAQPSLVERDLLGVWN